MLLWEGEGNGITISDLLQIWIVVVMDSLPEAGFNQRGVEDDPSLEDEQIPRIARLMLLYGVHWSNFPAGNIILIH